MKFGEVVWVDVTMNRTEFGSNRSKDLRVGWSVPWACEYDISGKIGVTTLLNSTVTLPALLRDLLLLQ